MGGHGLGVLVAVDGSNHKSDGKRVVVRPPPVATGLWEMMWLPREPRYGAKTCRAQRRCRCIDGMSTEQLRPWPKNEWSRARPVLDAGFHRPHSARR